MGYAFSGCNLHLITGFIILSRVLNAFLYSGCSTTPIDLSPAYAGAIKAVIDSVTCLGGILGPSAVEAIATNKVSKSNRLLFFLLLFLPGGNSFRQPKNGVLNN